MVGDPCCIRPPLLAALRRGTFLARRTREALTGCPLNAVAGTEVRRWWPDRGVLIGEAYRILRGSGPLWTLVQENGALALTR